MRTPFSAAPAPSTALYSALFLAFCLLAASLVSPAAHGERLTWWHWYPPEVWSAYEPLVSQFEQETGIEVRPRYVGWSKMREQLIIAVAGGIYPDVVTVSSRWADALATQGTFRYLDHSVGPKEQAPFFPAALDLWRTWDDHLYAFPLDLDVPVLFYNQDMFARFGTASPTDIDWSEWLQTARSLTRDTNGDDLPDMYGLTSWWYPWITLVWANGGRIATPDRNGLALGSSEAREAIEYFKRLYTEVPLPGLQDAERLGSDDPGGLWRSGLVAMAPAGAWMPRYHLVAAGSDEYAFNFGTAHMPKSPSGRRATPVEGSAVAVLKKAPAGAAALRFARFLSSATATAQVADKLEGFPARRSVARNVFERVGADGATLAAVTAYARPFPKGVDWWTSLEPIVMKELGRFIRGEEGLSAAVENAERQVKPILERLR